MRWRALVLMAFLLPGFAGADPGAPRHGHRVEPPSLGYPRRVLAVAEGVAGSRGSHGGALVRILGGGRMLVVGALVPRAGTTVVAEGPWTADGTWGGGVMWGGYLTPFEWPAPGELPLVLDSLEGVPPGGGLPDADVSWRRTLLDDDGFLEWRVLDLEGLGPGDPPLRLTLEAFRFEDRASPALAGLAQGRLKRDQAMNRFRSVGPGPRSPLGGRILTGRGGAWRTTFLAVATGPGSPATFWAVGGEWVVVLSGLDEPLVRDAGDAWCGGVDP